MFTKTQETINAATASYIGAMELLRDQLKAQLATVETQIDVCRKFADGSTCEPQPAKAEPEETKAGEAEQRMAKLRAMAAGTASGVIPTKTAEVARNAEGRPIAADLEQRLADALGAEPKAHAPAGL